MERLEGADKAISWFRYNGMKMNSDKCHLLVCCHKYELMIVNDSKLRKGYLLSAPEDFVWIIFEMWVISINWSYFFFINTEKIERIN